MRVAMVSWEYPPLVVGGSRCPRRMASRARWPGLGTKSSCSPCTIPTRPTTRGRRRPRGAGHTSTCPGCRTTTSSPRWSRANHQLVAARRPPGAWQADVVHAHDWLGCLGGRHVARGLWGSRFVATVHATERGRHRGHLPSTDCPTAINSVEWWLTYEAQRRSSAARRSWWTRSSAPSSCPRQDRRGAERRRPSALPGDCRPRAGADAPLIVSWGRVAVREGLPDVGRRGGPTRASLARRSVRARRPGHLPRTSCEAWPDGRRCRHRAPSPGSSPTTSSCACCTTPTCAVIPSLYEPFGIVALEALPAGAPLIAAESGGLREVLTGTDAGLVFPPGNADALAAAFERMLSEPGLIAKCQAAGTKLVATKYSSAMRSRHRPSRSTPSAGARPKKKSKPKATRFQSMKALRSFTVRPGLPAELAALEALAMNLRWSWDEQTRDLFRWVDPDAWEATVHDPVRLLGLVAPRPARGAGRRPGFMRFLARDPRPSSAATSPSPAGSRPRDGVTAAARSPTSPRSSASPRRCRSTPAASACWPATTSRRRATSACPSSASACSTARATSASS